ncbi:hypothetical protein [Streptomyces halobius]|uniref:Uncharacterized protein n=1 Tax=Streptomyces halobius TaxID=2879846 RepID=A0ABY4MHZ7_9ACTN|nr:hypothetical protein [Streptomyces halobius]UQA97373.1 hypothetical protein K9S39_40865 [Streptomyces halobius]
MEIRNNNASRVMADVGAGRIAAAFASLGAAAIHLASAPDHYAEWWPAGVFFYAIAVFQAGWAPAALRPSGRAVMLLGLLANAGSIALWAVSRTAGIPVGPSAGVPEAISRVGVTTVAFETVICLVALWYVPRRTPRGFASSLRAVVLVGAAGAAVTGVTVPAVEGAMNHSHSHSHRTVEDEQTPHGHNEDDGHDDVHPENTHSGSTAPDPGTEEASATHSAEESGATTEPSEQPADDEPGHDDTPHGH